MTEQKNTSDWQVGDRIVFDDVVGTYHSNCEINGTLYKHPSGDVRILSVNNNYENIDATIQAKDAEISELKRKLQISNEIYEANHAFTASLEQQLYADPWCYDLSKAPQRDDFLVCDEDHIFQTACISPVDKKIFIYEKAERKYFVPIAWMPIPEPKGETT